MAGIMDTITAAVKNLDLGDAGKAVGQAVDTGKAVSALSTAAAGAAENISAAAREARETVTMVKSDIDQAMTIAKVYAATTLALQAVAAFAALGIFMIQVKSYGDAKRRRVAHNPKRSKRSRR